MKRRAHVHSTAAALATLSYFGGNLHVGETQPNMGLDEPFGAVETNVEFLPYVDTSFKLGGIESAFVTRAYNQAYRM